MSDRRYGILIASSRFPDEPKLEDLRCPENDVDGLDEVLLSEIHGQFSETFLLKNVPHHEVLVKINEVLRKAKKNDLVLIYYSGHGKLNPAGRLHLSATNTIVSTLEATSIPVSTIKDYIDISPSNRVVLVLDCCFGAAADAAFVRSSVDDQLHLVSGGRGTYIMTASTGIQVALEKESDQYGVFTKHIIEGIRGGEADLDGDGRITMAELYSYVHDKVLEESHQEPTKCDLNVRGELVIAHSGKTPREKRSKQIRKKLFDLAAEDILPDDILDKAREVLAMEPTQLSDILRAYDDLLEQFRQERVEPVAFIRKWDEVGSKSLRSISEPPRPVGPEIVTIPDKLIDFGKIEAVFNNSLGMEFVLIPAGSFKRLTINKPFYMQTTEVTQAQWRAVMGNNPSHFKGDDRPVEGVSWNDVQAFIREINNNEGIDKYRLPTVAQWVYACRAGSTSRFCFGDSDGQLGEYAWYGGNSSSKTHSVGQKKPNAWGLYDMHGNVWEWCEDWQGDYPSGPLTDPVITGIREGWKRLFSSRVLHGGCWRSSARRCQSGYHTSSYPSVGDDGMGFRLARTP